MARQAEATGVHFSTGYSGAGDGPEQRGFEHPHIIAQAVYLGEDAFLLADEEVEVDIGHRMILSAQCDDTAMGEV